MLDKKTVNKKAVKAKQTKKKKTPRSVMDEGFLSSTEYEIESRKIQYGYHFRY